MYSIPNIEQCLEFAKSIGCSHILEVPIEPREYDLPFQCHNNCSFNPVLGYYIVKDSNQLLHAFKHSVLNTGNSLIDVTPTLDNRQYNIFCYGADMIEEHLTYIDNSVYINKSKKETEQMYYVYGLIDPRDNSVFYIGKGKDDRALSHFSESSLSKEGNTKKTAKIKKLNSLGFKPVIEFYAQNIIDEQLAYDIEAKLISIYGRIGYDDNGILTNICEDNKPPNHKGKSYEEIYGENAEEQKKKRSSLQLEAGGWFKRHKHTEESKRKISEKTSGKFNPRYGVRLKGTETAEKIGKANKGKKHYTRNDVKLLYIDGLDVFLYTNDLAAFCAKNGYSFGTFRKQLENKWPRSKRGMNAGLLIREATETEITSYISGGTKQDVGVDTFKGFTL